MQIRTGRRPSLLGLTTGVGAGGAAGAVARWCLQLLLPGPWTTLATNALGSACLGALVVLTARRSPWWRPVLGVGVLGGFTTFSTSMTDTRGLLAAGRPVPALALLLGTLLLSLLACWAGMTLARAARGEGRR